MVRRHALGTLLLLLPGLLAAAAPAPVRPTAGSVEYFEKHVRPVLAEHCYSCHGSKIQQGGLRLDQPGFLHAGGTNAVVRPGDPDGSRLIQAVRYTGELKMPPSGKLPAAQVEALVEWVKSGAAWPESPKGAGGASARPSLAYGPLGRAPAVPAVRNKAWVRTPIDAFILAELEKRGLRPAPPADRRTLIRRAYYDLIGLPPSAAEVDAFVADRAPDAYARLVDRLLASPQYGERWGRYWLDVARYADTKGYVRLTEERRFPYAFTYRDYVVRSFNEDKPYNRFILEQLAADELPPGSADLAALGFLTLGRRFTGNRHDIIDDRIDVVSRGLLGLTVTCARCHDHKFDPIPTADYYSLYGVFASSDDPAYPPLTGPADTPALRAHVAEFEKRKRVADEREERAFAALQDQFRRRSADYLVKSLEGPQPPQQPLPHTHDELRQLIVERWIDTLRDSGDDPVFAAWHAFAARDKGRFREEAAALTARWKSVGPDPKMNARVREYFVQHPPASMPEVARGYGALLEGVQQVVEDRRWAAADRASGLVNGSFEADGPTVNTSLRGWKLTGARLVTLGTEGRSDGEYAVVFGDGLPASTPPTAHTAELSQVIPTRKGVVYRVTFDYGAFGSGAPEAAQTLRARVRGGSLLAERTVTARGSIPSVLAPYELLFTADGEQATLSFTDATANGETGVADGVLDNVRLALVRDAAGNPPSPIRATAETAEVSAADRPFYDLLYGPASPVSITQNQALNNYLYDAAVNAEIYRLRNLAEAWLAQTDGAPLRAHTLVEMAPSRDARILIRGNPQRPGDRVPRRFLALLSGPVRRPFAPEHARLDLAREIVRSDNPLTARVFVNRVWQHHFGEGLVRTPSDFGARGAAPTHPALLDYLATCFTASPADGEKVGWSDGAKGTAMSHGQSLHPSVSPSLRLGWSAKRLHRLIMLSSTYQQSSRETPGGSDPENRLLGRMNRRRLDVEAFRDSVLAAAGQLDLRLGGPSMDLLDPTNHRRTLYAGIDRQNLPGMLRLFDFASPDAHAARRYTTTVPLQALFLLNSPFMEGCAQLLADRSGGSGPGMPPAERVRSLYRLALAREPTSAELQRGVRFVQGGSWAELAQVLLLSNEFAFVD